MRHCKTTRSRSISSDKVIVNVGVDHSDAMFQAVVNAHYEISRALYALGEFPEAYNEASAAAEAIPTSPEYLVARAKAALQVDKKDIAKEEVSAALRPSTLATPPPRCWGSYFARLAEGRRRHLNQAAYQGVYPGKNPGPGPTKTEPFGP